VLKLQLHNQLLLEYRGKTFSDKLKESIQKHLVENRIKQMKYENKLLPMCLVCVQEKKEIKSIGCSIPSDLINDNFGRMFASLFRPQATGVTNFTIQDQGNTSRTMRHYNSNPNAFNNSGNRFIQIGSGNTTPTRQDFNIENAFSNGGAEDVKQFFSNAGYNPVTGQIKQSVTFNATGAGVIAETTDVQNGLDAGGINRGWIWNRDLISPTSSFIGGQQIFVEYTWQF